MEPLREISTADLTNREWQITSLLVLGVTNKEIARSLDISESTVKNTITLIYKKTCVRSRAELAYWIASSRTGRPRLLIRLSVDLFLAEEDLFDKDRLYKAIESSCDGLVASQITEKSRVVLLRPE